MLVQYVPEPDIGTSIVPVIQDGSLPWRKRFLVEHGTFRFGVLHVPPYAGIRTTHEDTMPELMYAEHDDKEFPDKEFYDLSTDPYQLTNLQSIEPTERLTQIERLSGILKELKTCQGSTCHTLEFAE